MHNWHELGHILLYMHTNILYMHIIGVVCTSPECQRLLKFLLTVV